MNATDEELEKLSKVGPRVKALVDEVRQLRETVQRLGIDLATQHQAAHEHDAQLMEMGREFMKLAAKFGLMRAPSATSDIAFPGPEIPHFFREKGE